MTSYHLIKDYVGGMWPDVALNFVMLYQQQRQGQKWQRKGAQRNGNLQHVPQEPSNYSLNLKFENLLLLQF
jgi:hypothetical protein